MATNQTTNYQLNQWEPTDQVLRTDFNADNAKLDAALAVLADSKADQSGLDALSDALTGLSGTVSAVSARAGNCDMELLTYIGTGAMGSSSPTQITFTLLPDVFVIAGDLAILLGQGGGTEAILVCKDASYSGSFVSDADVTWNGSTMSTYNNVNARYQMNSANKIYWVLGLKKK